jgi:hypothetical protein
MLTLMVNVPSMGEGVAVAAGGCGVSVKAGVSVEYWVGAGVAEAVGVATGCIVTQAVASRGRTVSKMMSRFISIILLLFGYGRGGGKRMESREIID